MRRSARAATAPLAARSLRCYTRRRSDEPIPAAADPLLPRRRFTAFRRARAADLARAGVRKPVVGRHHAADGRDLLLHRALLPLGAEAELPARIRAGGGVRLR